MIKWQYYPKADKIPDFLNSVVNLFDKNYNKISSEKHKLESNGVLLKIRKDLENEGYLVEKGKKMNDKIRIPVLFGQNGNPEKSFDADAYNYINKTVLEVEAGRAFTNNQFLKDLFQACVMYDTDYLIIAVRIEYRKNKDFEKIKTFFDTLYSSYKFRLPLKGFLLIGY